MRLEMPTWVSERHRVSCSLSLTVSLTRRQVVLSGSQSIALQLGLVFGVFCKTSQNGVPGIVWTITDLLPYFRMCCATFSAFVICYLLSFYQHVSFPSESTVFLGEACSEDVNCVYAGLKF